VSAGHTVTQLLVEWGKGNPQALEELTPLVYAELRRLAASYFRKERPDHTLQPTALVHEAYLRLVGQQKVNWQNRSHFFGVAARLLSQILVDYARRQRAGKRAGRKVSLEDTVSLAPGRSGDLAALDDALTALEKFDARKCKAVELRYFGGLEVEEISQALQVSPVTVRRDLKVAESWLYHEMRNG